MSSKSAHIRPRPKPKSRKPKAQEMYKSSEFIEDDGADVASAPSKAVAQHAIAEVVLSGCSSQ
jgi:hypothetical protein